MRSRLPRLSTVLWGTWIALLLVVGLFSVRHNSNVSWNSHSYGEFTLRAGWGTLDFLWTTAAESRYFEEGGDIVFGKEIYGGTSDLQAVDPGDRQPSYFSFFTALPAIRWDEYGFVIGIPFLWLFIISVLVWIFTSHGRTE